MAEKKAKFFRLFLSFVFSPPSFGVGSELAIKRFQDFLVSFSNGREKCIVSTAVRTLVSNSILSLGLVKGGLDKMMS